MALRLRLVVIKFCGLMGFSLAGIHAVLALTIWTPAYFAKYFDEAGQLNLQGALGMVAGVVALFFLTSPAISTLPMMPKALGGKRWKRAPVVPKSAPSLGEFFGTEPDGGFADLFQQNAKSNLRRFVGDCEAIHRVSAGPRNRRDADIRRYFSSLLVL